MLLWMLGFSLNNYYVMLTRAVIHVENTLQQAGQPIGFKYGKTLRALRELSTEWS